jgi:hypothetical protein
MHKQAWRCEQSFEAAGSASGGGPPSNHHDAARALTLGWQGSQEGWRA